MELPFCGKENDDGTKMRQLRRKDGRKISDPPGKTGGFVIFGENSQFFFFFFWGFG